MENGQEVGKGVSGARWFSNESCSRNVISRTDMRLPTSVANKRPPSWANELGDWKQLFSERANLTVASYHRLPSLP